MSARMTRESSPAAIEDDLVRLWRDAAREAPIARALMANLIVYRDRPAKEDVDDVDLAAADALVEEVAVRHPSRTIVLYHGGRPGARVPPGAHVTILLCGPQQSRWGIEEIALRTACADASLPSIVRRLALGDVPTSIWWTEDLSAVTPLEALASMGRQFVYDSRQWRDVRRGVLAVAPLAAAGALDVADVNWRRLTAMRQALVQSAAAYGPAATVHIRHRPGDGALAWLLAGWFASRLGWPAAGPWPATIEEARHGDEILSLVLGADEAIAAMNGHRVLIRFKARVPPLSIAVPHETQADAIAAELRSLTRDACLRDTLAALAARFSASTAA